MTQVAVPAGPSCTGLVRASTSPCLDRRRGTVANTQVVPRPCRYRYLGSGGGARWARHLFGPYDAGRAGCRGPIQRRR